MAMVSLRNNSAELFRVFPKVNKMLGISDREFRSSEL